MSATNRGGERKKNDAYLTDRDLSRYLVGELKKDLAELRTPWHDGNGLRFLEPSAGDGSFVSAVRHHFPKAHITAIELRGVYASSLKRAGANEVHQGMFERISRENLVDRKFDVIVGNPPYSVAEEHCRLCFGHLRKDGLFAFLLPQGFQNSSEREKFWTEFPLKYNRTLTPRPSFTMGGTDQVEYGMFTWQGEFAWLDGWTRMRRLCWKQPQSTKEKSRARRRVAIDS